MGKKKLSEITREEWVRFQWQETTQMGDEERIFIKDYQRTPDEARQAMEDWDLIEEGLKQNSENEK